LAGRDTVPASDGDEPAGRDRGGGGAGGGAARRGPVQRAGADPAAGRAHHPSRGDRGAPAPDRTGPVDGDAVGGRAAGGAHLRAVRGPEGAARAALPGLVGPAGLATTAPTEDEVARRSGHGP